MRFREGQPSNDGSGPNSGPEAKPELGADPRSQAYEALSRRVAKARAEQRLLSPDGTYRLADLELNHLLQVYHNLSVPELVEHALMRGEGGLSAEGALCVKTVPHTTRSPHHTFIVDWDETAPILTEPSSPNLNAEEQPHLAQSALEQRPSSLSESAFRHLYQEAQAYVQGRSLYVIDGELITGVSVRIITELASQALFARQLLRPSATVSTTSVPLSKTDNSQDSAQALQIVLIVLPGLKGEPSLEPELTDDVFTAIHPCHHLALLGGSRHFGEITAALMHLSRPILLDHGALPLEQCHFDAAPLGLEENHGLAPDLQTQPSSQSGLALSLGVHRSAAKPWIWSNQTMFPLTTGHYKPVPHPLGDAAAIPPDEVRFGTLLENVILEPQTGRPMFGDRRWSEVPYLMAPGNGQSLTATVHTLLIHMPDTLGIFPPIARLTLEQAQFYYLCGYGNWEDDIVDPLCQTSSPIGLSPSSTQEFSQQLGTFRPCFCSEMSREQAIASVKRLGDRIAALPTPPEIFLINRCSPAAQTSAEASSQSLSSQSFSSRYHNAPWLTPQWFEQQRFKQPTSSSPFLTERLFQYFDQYIQQFKADIPASILTAQPRLQ